MPFDRLVEISLRIMSISRRIKQGFLRLPTSRKAVLLSSALLSVSVIMPWYDQRNAAGVGESYLGFQGPLFLIGLLVAAAGIISFSNLFLPLMGRNYFKMRKKSGQLSLVLGLQSLFMVLIANSVFYHPAFGIGASQKATRFGMVIAFASLFVMISAAWQVHRREKNGDFEQMDNQVHEDPVVDIAPAPQATPVYSSQPISSPSVSPSPRPEPRPMPSNYANSYTAQRMRSSFQAPNQTQPVNSASSSSAGVDPLTLDPKERYKLMRQKQRMSQAAKGNLWQGSSNLPR